MKKTISINLSGTIFNIEEDAYQKLNDYLESIKNHYDAKESAEIINDIESSIAEKFRAKITRKKQVVTLKEVEEIIKVMGTVEEIGVEAEGGANAQEGNKAGNEEVGFRKLYRNPDDVIIAGVCSGLAAYFGIDSVIVRIIFVLLLFLNGFGLLAYIVLWIIMPRAETGAQKLAMRGKPVNLKKIEQAVKEKSKMLKKEGGQALRKMGKNKAMFYKIINLPIKIIENFFSLTGRVIKKIVPIFVVFFGIIIVFGMLAAILGLILAAGVLIFNIDSPLIVSDVPLEDLSHNISYQVFIVAVFLIATIPLLFILLLGLMLVRRKNVFGLRLSVVLIALWMFSVAAVGVAGLKLAPRVKDAIDDINSRELIIKNYDIKDYDKIRIGGEAQIKVSQGEEYSFKVEGDEDNINNFQYEINEGELTIGRNVRRGGICVLCFRKPYNIEVTAPRLDSFIAYGSVEAEVDGFKNDIRINAGEAAKVKAYLDGQNLKSYIAGTGGRIEIIGSPATIDAVLEGNGRLNAMDLDCQNITINQSIMSRTYLGGKTAKLNLEAESTARAYAIELAALEANVKAITYARAEVYPLEKLKAIAQNHGLIIYRGQPEFITQKTTEGGVIKAKEDLDFDDYESEMPAERDEDIFGFQIKTDTDSYAPFMSSRRGIGLMPVLFADFQNEDLSTYKFIWQAEGGLLVADWNSDERLTRIENRGEKIYWTYSGDGFEDRPGKKFNISLEMVDGDGISLGISELELSLEENGIVKVIR